MVGVLVAFALAAFLLLLIPAALLPLLTGTDLDAETIDQLRRGPRPAPPGETWVDQHPIAA